MKPQSFVLLGTNFLRHVFARATFTYDRGGIQRFRANFDHQGLLPLDARARALLPAWQRCTACGLCDLVCPDLLGALTQHRLSGPMALPHALLRDLPDLADATPPDEDALTATCGDCHACEDICPAHIPLRDLAAFLAEVGQHARDTRIPGPPRSPPPP